MPFTPLHFGPGAALHVLAPRSVSFLAFCAANVLIDLESLHNLLLDQHPVHGFVHSVVGATLAVLATLGLHLALRGLATKIPLPNIFQWHELTYMQVGLGAALGAYSHIVLDGIMHADARPFAPFSEANPFLGFMSIDALYVLCVALGAVALVVLLFRRLIRSKGAA